MVSIKIVLEHPGATMPRYVTEGAAGMDIAACEGGCIAPGARLVVSTGFCMQIPPGLEAQIRPRSGLAAKHGVTVLNAPGTIDCDYTGIVGVILINHGHDIFHFEAGSRIAQMVIAAVKVAHLVEVDFLKETDRGDGGYGHTGVK